MISSIRNRTFLGLLLGAVTTASVSLASTLGDQPFVPCLNPENCETKTTAEPATDAADGRETTPAIHRSRISTEHVGRR